MKIYKFISAALFAILITANFLRAGDTYPDEYVLLETHPDSYFIATEPEKGGEPVSYLIKDSWVTAPQVLYKWKGIRRSHGIAKSLGDSRILAAAGYNSFLLAAWKDKERFFTGIIDTSGETISIAELFVNIQPYSFLEEKFIKTPLDNEYLLLLNDFLFKCRIDSSGKISVEFISESIIGALADDTVSFDVHPASYNIACLTRQNNSLTLFFVDNSGIKSIPVLLPFGDIAQIYMSGGEAYIISSSNTMKYSLLIAAKKNEGVIWSKEVPCPGNLVKIRRIGDESILYFIFSDSEGYKIAISSAKSLSASETWEVTQLPKDFIEPMAFRRLDDKFFLIFRNGIASFDLKGIIQSLDYIPFGEYLTSKPAIGRIGRYIFLSTPNHSIILESRKNNFWILNRFFDTSGRYVLPFILFAAFLVIWQMYRHQRRFLRTILSLPSTGAVFIFDHIGRLINANTKARVLLAIPESFPLHRIYSYYCKDDSLTQFVELVVKSLQSRTSLNQKITISESELYCTVTTLTNILGSFKGFVLTAFDITEELQRKRLSNWAQLAHDMQTNLTTIRLNAELMDFDFDPDNISRKKKIIQQAGILIQRVRDIVTVGRTYKLDKGQFNSHDICREVLEEFDTALYPGIEFIRICQEFPFVCDKQKFIRALRNAVENSIKAMKNSNGIIELSCRQDSAFNYFIIKDNGSGMDENTKQNMLKPYFTGSPEKGGTGIGTMIMQHVLELHGGKIEIHSEPGKGTELVFILPGIRIKR